MTSSGGAVEMDPISKPSISGSVRFVISRMGSLIGYFYVSRVPLVGLLLLWGLPWAATGALRTLVLGAYDFGTLPSAGMPVWKANVLTILEAAFAGLAVCALVASVFVSARIIWELGTKRYKVGPSSHARPLIRRVWTVLLAGGLVLNAIVAIRASDRHLWWQILTGFLLSIGLARAAEKWLLPWIERRLGKGSRRSWLLCLMKALGLDEGYVAKAAEDEHIERGHIAALAYSAVLLVVYAALIHAPISPLVTVMMVAAIAVLVLGAAAFFLDRYRVPLLVFVLIYCALMSLWWQNDHYYRIWGPLDAASAIPADASPDRVIAAAVRQKRPIVVVASAGGGIQATAWTTATLRRIGEELEKSGILSEDDFARSVRLISGVSGGSVGGLFYAMAVHQKGIDRRFERADAAAQSSGLGRAMRGLLRDDMVRAIAPFVIRNGHKFPMNIYADRGHELEMAWIGNAEDQFEKYSGLPHATLASWSRDAMKLRRPALVFNSTLVETGERFAISTVPGARQYVGSCEFAHRYKNADLAMTTAARLSATFPLISPTARPGPAADANAPGYSLPGPDFWPLFPRGGNYLHAVDGGYYENSGIIGAVEWLDDAFTGLVEKKQPLPGKVLFIELNAFPFGEQRDETRNPLPNEAAIDEGQQSHGTLYDLVSPLPAIMNVRNSGQKAFATRVLDLFRARWARVPVGETALKSTNVQHVAFYYDFSKSLTERAAERTAAMSPAGGRWNQFLNWFFVGADPQHQPLSWHLRPAEKNDIAAHLEHLAESESFGRIKEFFQFP